jgi:antitoxin HigA-1
MTADTALRLGLFFGTSPEFWLNAQLAYDLSKAKAEHNYSKVKPRHAA